MNLLKPTRKANETRDLTHPCRVALNAMDGVRVWRNNVGRMPLPSGGWLQYGLAIGSADLIGFVRVRLETCGPTDHPGEYHETFIARFFSIETKSPGKKQTPEQAAWAKVVRSMGGFACVVRSIAEAFDAVRRCRNGESQ